MEKSNKVYVVNVKLLNGNWVKYRAVQGSAGVKRLVKYFDDNFTGIYIDDKDLYLETKEYMQEIAPSKSSVVKLYNNKSLPLFEKFNIERQIKTSFGNV